jgi:hypothetical protein
MKPLLASLRSLVITGMIAACSGEDGGGGDGGTSCGPSPCGACMTGCRADDRCEAGGWSCHCVCSDAGADAGDSDAGRGDDAGVPDAGATDTGTPGDAGGGDAASSCDDATAALTAFIATNDDCTMDSDCVEVAASCYSMQEDCCVIYVKAGYDAAQWAALYGAVEACAVGSGGGCGCCAALPAPPGCIMGRCGPLR